MVNDVVNPNMMCYCQHLLWENTSESVQTQYHCRLCQKSLDNKRYDCDNESCIYKRISGLQFWICPSCYDQNADVILNYTEDEWKQIFVSKLRSSISAISYMANVSVPFVLRFFVLPETHNLLIFQHFRASPSWIGEWWTFRGGFCPYPPSRSHFHQFQCGGGVCTQCDRWWWFIMGSGWGSEKGSCRGTIKSHSEFGWISM